MPLIYTYVDHLAWGHGSLKRNSCSNLRKSSKRTAYCPYRKKKIYFLEIISFCKFCSTLAYGRSSGRPQRQRRHQEFQIWILRPSASCCGEAGLTILYSSTVLTVLIPVLHCTFLRQNPRDAAPPSRLTKLEESRSFWPQFSPYYSHRLIQMENLTSNNVRESSRSGWLACRIRLTYTILNQCA